MSGSILTRRHDFDVVGLSSRAGRYLASCAADDPIVVANALIFEAIALQDRGLFDEAEKLLTQAGRLLDREES